MVIRDGHAVTSVVTDGAGRFKLRLAPGTYQFTAHSAVGFRSQASRTVTVPTSHPVELTIDSGMR